jgi:hypothetical protein
LCRYIVRVNRCEQFDFSLQQNQIVASIVASGLLHLRGRGDIATLAKQLTLVPVAFARCARVASLGSPL